MKLSHKNRYSCLIRSNYTIQWPTGPFTNELSDAPEAFALLLIDNYLEKWKTILGVEEQSADAEAVGNTNMTGEAQAGGRQKKKAAKKLPGKYTEKKSGHCKYGGWSHAGMARFNQQYSLVNDDTASAQSEQMEHELLGST